jgi:hypothetical protein
MNFNMMQWFINALPFMKPIFITLGVVIAICIVILICRVIYKYTKKIN